MTDRRTHLATQRMDHSDMDSGASGVGLPAVTDEYASCRIFRPAIIALDGDGTAE